MRRAVQVTIPYPLKGDQRPMTLNLGSPPEKIGVGDFWKFAGVDGRFSDTARRFPGFRRLEYTLETDGISRVTAAANADITQMTRIVLFKYAAIKKADSKHLLRGFVVIGNDYVNNSTTTSLALFIHYDTETTRWYGYKLTSLSGLSLDQEFDCTVSKRALVVVTELGQSYTYFWKYAGTGTGPTLPAFGNGSIVEVPAGPAGGVFTPTVNAVQDGTNGRLVNTQRAPTYQVMFRAFDPNRNLWGTASGPTTVLQNGNPLTQNTQYRIDVTIPRATVIQLVSRGFTKIYCYRTIDGGGDFYLEQIANFSPNTGSVGVDTDNATDYFYGTDNAGILTYVVSMGSRVALHTPATVLSTSVNWSLGMADEAVVVQKQFDPFLDATGNLPAGGLIESYGDMMIARDSLSSSGGTQASVRWSSLFHPETENFPEGDHAYGPSTVGTKVIAIKEGGDYCFALRDDSVVRFHRNGTIMAVNELYRKIGGTGRYAACCLGSTLYYGTSMGAMVVDGTSGRQDMVGALERVFIDPLYWRKSLTGIHMGFDNELGALFILNRAFEEAYILWLGNGSITSLEDMPFQYLTEGTDPILGGNLRTWWLGPTGFIYYCNYDRSFPRQTMCGIKSDEIANGICLMSGISAADKTTKFKALPVTGSYPLAMAPCRGFWIHFLSGNNKGLRRKVLALDTTASPNTVTIQTPLPYDLADGDKFSVAPIFFDVGLYSLRLSNEPDMFGAKTLHALGAAVNFFSGDFSRISNPSAFLEYSIVNPEGPTVGGDVFMEQDSSKMFKEIKATGNSLFPRFTQRASDLDFELLSVQASATMLVSEAQTAS